MFIGHYAVGLSASRRAPLWVLLAAPQLLDLLWPVFVLLGLESFHVAPGNTAFTPLSFDHYPWSHSLLMACVWGALFALLVRRAIAFPLVVSHWVLDFATHTADMPLWPGGPRVGLGLWNHPAATAIVEVAMFAGATVIYLRSTRAKDRTGAWALYALLAFLLLVYVANLLGPPPPNEKAVAASALLLWLIPLWGVWIDRHRVLRPSATP